MQYPHRGSLIGIGRQRVALSIKSFIATITARPGFVTVHPPPQSGAHLDQ